MEDFDKQSLEDLLSTDEVEAMIKKGEEMKDTFTGVIVISVGCLVYSLYFFGLSFGFYGQSALQILVNCLAIFPLFSLGLGTLISKVMLIKQGLM